MDVVNGQALRLLALRAAKARNDIGGAVRIVLEQGGPLVSLVERFWSIRVENWFVFSVPTRLKL